MKEVKLQNILFCCILIVFGTSAHAQLPSGSNIVSRTYLRSNGTKLLEQRVYDNGLGDIVREVQSFPGTSFPNIIVKTEYDTYRRKTKTWLPITSSSGSGYLANYMINNIAQDQYEDYAPFQLTVYDRFLPSQPSAQYKAGSVWQNNDKKVAITYSDSVMVEMYMLDYELDVYSGTKYFCTRYIDEDGCPKTEYSDVKGRLKISETSQGKTYYVYNDKGDIGYVIPPALSEHIISYVNNGVLNMEDIPEFEEMMYKYAYAYRYDYKRNCIYKKLPGCEPIYYIYDKAGKCIFSQDGNQRQRGEWAYSIPDKFGRPAISGVCHNSISYSLDPMQQNPLSVNVYAEYDGVSASMGGYTVRNYSLDSQTLYSASYYDSYSFIGHHGVPSTLTSSTITGYPVDTTLGYGLQTGSATAVIGNNGVTGYTYSAIYYDSRYNVSQVVATNHKGGRDITFTSFSYTGKPLSVKTQHIMNANIINECYTYAYDDADRLSAVSHSINNGTPVTLVQNSYNNLGQLASVSKPISNGHTTSYSYDMHSWLTSIDAGNLFQEQLKYANSSVPCYSGNISAVTWKAGNMNLQREYKFEYDNASRLHQATYAEGSLNMNKYGTTYQYDLMGNIISLTRKGLRDNGIYGNMDRLTLSYDGNQLMSVSDAVTDPTYNNAWNFVDGASASQEYEYDQNGNVTKDSNKKILSIQYNSLNLPRKINFSGGSMTSLTYSADGKKLKAVYAANTISPLDATTPINSWSNPASESVNSTGGGIAPVLTGNMTVEYVGNLIYENGVLKQMLVEGGYVSFGTNNAPTYHFYIQDHLGNNRVVVSQSGTVEQVNHYYPYGVLMAESTGWNTQRYKYNGKELDRMHGLDWYDYGARWMDAAIGRWHSMDPLCEKFYDISPYLYCKGDPINKFDPDGRIPFLANIVGGCIGATVEVGTQMISKAIVGGDITDIDVKQVGAAFVEGTLTCGGSAFRKGAVTVAGALVRSAIDKETNNKTDFVVKTALNIVPSAVGKSAKKIKLEPVNKFANKVTSNNQVKKQLKKTFGMNSKDANNLTKKTAGIRKSTAKVIRKTPQQASTVVSGIGAGVIDEARDKKK